MISWFRPLVPTSLRTRTSTTKSSITFPSYCSLTITFKYYDDAGFLIINSTIIDSTTADYSHEREITYTHIHADSQSESGSKQIARRMPSENLYQFFISSNKLYTHDYKLLNMHVYVSHNTLDCKLKYSMDEN